MTILYIILNLIFKNKSFIISFCFLTFINLTQLLIENVKFDLIKIIKYINDFIYCWYNFLTCSLIVSILFFKRIF